MIESPLSVDVSIDSVLVGGGNGGMGSRVLRPAKATSNGGNYIVYVQMCVHNVN